MARIRHPDTFYGAISSSPLLTLFGSTTSNPFKFAAANWTANVYQKKSSKVTAKIRDALWIFQNCGMSS